MSIGTLPKGEKYAATGTRRPPARQRIVVLKRDQVVRAAGGKKKLAAMTFRQACRALYKANESLVKAAFKRPNVVEVVDFGDRIGSIAETVNGR